ncbi:hypothetical protein MRX96_003644 [Rhipicephalus microplus]
MFFLSFKGAIKLPSSGTAFFDGADMRTNGSKVRPHIGYCPQNSTLIPFLTVEENLLFIAYLRDVLQPSERDSIQGEEPRSAQIDDLILTLLTQFQLIDQRESLASKITYAEQRRLQVAMTLLDNPLFALFDCPYGRNRHGLAQCDLGRHTQVPPPDNGGARHEQQRRG